MAVTEFALDRILAEGTANAVRHAGASSVQATVGIRNGYLKLEIADDGTGFAGKDGPNGAAPIELRRGPRSLRDRAAARGGRLSLGPSEKGARILIELPLASQHYA